jgi:hypothetical protein
VIFRSLQITTARNFQLFQTTRKELPIVWRRLGIPFHPGLDPPHGNCPLDCKHLNLSFIWRHPLNVWHPPLINWRLPLVLWPCERRLCPLCEFCSDCANPDARSREMAVSVWLEKGLDSWGVRGDRATEDLVRVLLEVVQGLRGRNG